MRTALAAGRLRHGDDVCRAPDVEFHAAAQVALRTRTYLQVMGVLNLEVLHA